MNIVKKGGHAVTGTLPSNADATQVTARPAVFPGSPQVAARGSLSGGKAGGTSKKKFPPAS